MIDTNLKQETFNTTMVADTHYMVYTDIIIDKPPEQVWKVLTDFENIPNWSSSFKGITGDISDGGSVIVLFDIGMGIVEIPHTLIYEEGVEYGWNEEVFGAPGIIDNHRNRVEKISDCQSRFVQSDEFVGSGANATAEGFANQKLSFYRAFNAELKTEVESR